MSRTVSLNTEGIVVSRNGKYRGCGKVGFKVVECTLFYTPPLPVYVPGKTTERMGNVSKAMNKFAIEIDEP